MEDVSRGSSAEPPGLRPRLAAWILPAGLYAAITIQSSVALHIPGAAIPFGDKILHAIVYGVLGALVSRAVRRSVARRLSAVTIVLGVALFASFLGAVDEFHQSFVPGRSPEAFDGLADVIGAGIGSGLYMWATTRRGRARGGR